MQSAPFQIDATGILTFDPAPDFEAPTRFGRRNSLQRHCQGRGRGGGFDEQSLQIRVTDQNSFPGTIGRNRFKGDNGAGTMSDGVGDDMLTGGTGADRFVFSGNFGQNSASGST